MKILVIFLLMFSLNSYGQNSRITIHAEGEKVSYNLKKCYKSGKLIRMHSGRKFKVVIYGGYAPWTKKCR